jgi:hypothetical protein
MPAGEELRRAVDSMFRIRAVESPPDASGSRRIWHRGTSGAELFTEVDGRGKVARQEFTLFEEVLRWDHEHGFQRSAVELGRVAAVLQPYGGADRFILHLKERAIEQARPVPLGMDVAPGRPEAKSALEGSPGRTRGLRVAVALAGLGAIVAWLAWRWR